MSGRDDRRGGGGPREANTISCASIRFEAQLTSPQPAVVGNLSVGDVLDINVATRGGQIVVQALKNGQVAGGLTGPDASRLRNCIEDGHNYKATVRVINGGQVRVLVEHV